MAKRIAGCKSVGLILAIVLATAFAACTNDVASGPQVPDSGASALDSGPSEVGAADASLDAAVDGTVTIATGDAEDAGADALVAVDASVPADAPSQPDTGGSMDGPGDATWSDATWSAATASDAMPDDDASSDAVPGHDASSDAVSSDDSSSDAMPGDESSDAVPGHDASSDAVSSDDSSSDATATLGVDCSSDAGGLIGATGAPFHLACTGLYANWSSGAIAPGVLPFDPGIFLWADGADKTRYIYLPPGTTIDTSNMDEWTFPAGTKIWKQFALNGLKVETRYLYKTTSTSWVWTTYQWSVDQTTATELTTGATDVNGTTYEIPDHDMCQTCHQGRLDFVLGFEAIGLSTPAATGLTMSALVADGLLTSPPSTPLVIPGDAAASAALGWLHANCGNACHNPSRNAFAGWTGFYMRLSAAGLGSVEATSTYRTGVNVPAGYTPPDGGTLMLIAAGDPSNSCVTFRDGHRDTQGEGVQMPPMDTHVVDTAGVELVSDWISSLGDAGTAGD